MNYKKMMGPYQNISHSIFIIFLARVVNSLGNFVMPFLTIFLTDKQKLSKTEAGRFVMIAALFYAAGSLVGGKLCDRMGRKKVLIIFQGASALFLIPCAFLEALHVIPWLLIISAFFRGAAEPSHMAMVTDLTDYENRKVAFSFLYLGNNIGFALGPMLAGLLYREYLPWIFIGDALTTVVSLILVIMYIKETIPFKEIRGIPEPTLGYNERAEEGGLFSVILKRPMLLIFSVIMVIYSLVYTQFSFSLPIQVDEIFTMEGPKYFGLLMTVNAITVVLLTPIITGITIKLKPTLAIILGGLLYAMGFGMIFFINSMFLFAISTIIWTVGEIFVTTNSGVYIANNTPISHRGRFNAVFPILTSAGYAIGPFITGAFIDNAKDTRLVWVLCFIFALFASVMMVGLHFLERSHSKKRYEDGLKGSNS